MFPVLLVLAYPVAMELELRTLEILPVLVLIGISIAISYFLYKKTANRWVWWLCPLVLASAYRASVFLG